MNSLVSKWRLIGATTCCRALWASPHRRWCSEEHNNRKNVSSCPHGVQRRLHTDNAASSSSGNNQTLTHSVNNSVANHSTEELTRQPVNASGSPITVATTSTSSGSQAAKTTQRLLLLSTADSFAQSRMKNYVQRILVTPAPAGADAADSAHNGDNSIGNSSSRVSSVFDVVPRLLSKEEKTQLTSSMRLSLAYAASFVFPVDVFVGNHLTRRLITAVGLAADAKMSVIAACMHAERCLDALRIPIFTSERRQHQRVLQAQAEGRTAAQVSDLPRELSSVVLPPPVALPSSSSAPTTQRLASYQPKLGNTVVATGAASSLFSVAEGENVKGVVHDHRGLHARCHSKNLLLRKNPRRRFDTYTTRYSSGQFMQATLKELAALQSTLLAHNRPEGDDDEDDGDDQQEADSMYIAPEEVAILRPELLPQARFPGATGHSDTPAAVVGRVTGVRDSPHTLMLEQNMKMRFKSDCVKRLDESEGGLYNLVEGAPGEWCWEPEVPGSWCMRDTTAVARVNGYLVRVTGHSFTDSIEVRFTDESTYTLMEEKSRYEYMMKRWYVVSLDLCEIGVRATGKAMTQNGAKDLCAMHAELLLQWFGVPLYVSPHAQARYYDACLKWGRHVAATPVDPSTVHAQTTKLPKPLKEWVRTSKARVRGAERNVMEKLLLLNRAVVHAYRKHLVETDLFASDKFTELLSLVEPCVRSFMVAMQHPFESAYFNLVYTEGSQYRTTIYLPLPERYGVRGGYAIATTPQHGVTLCALNAIDVLCLLDVIPHVCMMQPRWQRLMELRESFGLILPPSYLYARRLAAATTDAARAALGPPPPPPHSQLRSPPGYREVPGVTPDIPRHEDVWRIMLLDADVFDVIPDVVTLQKSTRERCLVDYALQPQTFFEEAMHYLFHWDIAAKEHHKHMFHYVGAQRFHNIQKTGANNFWMELPLDTAVYGKRVAVGRCISRRGAERAMYVHVLRILRALKLAPWDKMSNSQLVRELYSKRPLRAHQRMQEWRWLCAAVLDGSEDGVETLNLSVPEAEVISEVMPELTSAELKGKKNDPAAPLSMVHILSPHPVMTRELAVFTLP